MMPIRRETVLFRRAWQTVVLVAAAAALTGCGGDSLQRTTVHGKVTFDGAPVAKGMIAFLPAEGVAGPTSGAEIKDGAYSITMENGPVAGAHRVEITATREDGSQAGASMQNAPAAGPSGMPTGPTVTMYIPANYNRDSTLKQEIKAGDNELNFDLKGTP